MPITAFATSIPTSAWEENIALRFYAAYSKAFSSHFDTTPYDDFYAASCKMYLSDNSVMKGGSSIWSFFGGLYRAIPKVTRDLLSIIVMSDDDARTHVIHAEFLTTLRLDSEVHKVEVPQAFVYTLAKADEGKGTYGLQYVSLRNYYDMSLVERAKAEL